MASHVTGPHLNRDNNVGNRVWQSNMPTSQDPDYIVYHNDFVETQDYIATEEWTVTTVEDGGGDATEALVADSLGGELLITNDAGAGDSDSLQMKQDTWKMASGKRLWYECRVKMADVSNMLVFIGLCITDTTPLASADRAGFQWADTDASINVTAEKSDAETLTDSGKDAADATYVKLGMYWDGEAALEYYVDRKKVATHTANVPDDVNMTATFHITNGAVAAANTLTIDYVYICQER